MKYIKQYERKLNPLTNIVKKFVLIENESGFFIFEIALKNYLCSQLFHSKTYIPINKKDIISTASYFYKIDNVLKFDDKLIFQSNKLDDVIKYFEMIASANKFNL